MLGEIGLANGFPFVQESSVRCAGGQACVRYLTKIYKQIPFSVLLVLKLSSSILLLGTVGLVAPGTLLVAGFFKANTQNFSLFCPDKSAEINTQTRIQRYTVFI